MSTERRRGLITGFLAGVAIALAASATVIAIEGGIGGSDEASQSAIDVIQKDYFRPVGGQLLDNASVDGMVRTLRKRYDDHFSHYFNPHELRQFEQTFRSNLTDQLRRHIDILESGHAEPGDLPELATSSASIGAPTTDPADTAATTAEASTEAGTDEDVAVEGGTREHGAAEDESADERSTGTSGRSGGGVSSLAGDRPGVAVTPGTLASGPRGSANLPRL